MPANFERICLMVLDSAGIGEMPDAAAWGDAGADTLGGGADKDISEDLLPVGAHHDKIAVD